MRNMREADSNVVVVNVVKKTGVEFVVDVIVVVFVVSVVVVDVIPQFARHIHKVYSGVVVTVVVVVVL